MKIFVSWSKQPSKTIAEELKHFLSMTLGSVTPWMSEVDIQKGKRWGDQIAAELDETMVGIVVCTPNNLWEPWIHFEAGALAKTKDSSLHPLCFDVDKNSLTGALAQFQATAFDHDDFLDLLRSINHGNPNKLKSTDLEARFERAWPQLDQKVKEALAAYSTQTQASASSIGNISAMNALREAQFRNQGANKASSMLAKAAGIVGPTSPKPTDIVEIDRGNAAAFNMAVGGASGLRAIKSKLIDELSQEQGQILQIVASAGSAFSVDEIAKLCHMSHIRTAHHMEVLERGGFLASILHMGSGVRYTLTPKSRQLVVEEGWDLL